jgi:hypothetical protein
MALGRAAEDRYKPNELMQENVLPDLVGLSIVRRNPNLVDALFSEPPTMLDRTGRSR